jgi:hypothetical protein
MPLQRAASLPWAYSTHVIFAPLLGVRVNQREDHNDSGKTQENQHVVMSKAVLSQCSVCIWQVYCRTPLAEQTGCFFRVFASTWPQRLEMMV